MNVIAILLAVVRLRRGRGRASGRAGDCGERVLLVPERDLARVTGDMNAAYILRRVRDWVASNERLRKSAYALNGEYWCVQSYRQWVHDADWLSERQVARLIRDLEARGLLISVRWRNGGAKGYRVDEEKLAAALAALAPAVVPEREGVSPIRLTLDAKREGVSPIRPTPRAKTSIESNKESNQQQSSEKSSKQSSAPPARRIDDDYTEADLVKEFGDEAAFQAMEKARQFRARHPVAYARRVALERARPAEDGERDPVERYVGQYAAFIQH